MPDNAYNHFKQSEPLFENNKPFASALSSECWNDIGAKASLARAQESTSSAPYLQPIELTYAEGPAASGDTRLAGNFSVGFGTESTVVTNSKTKQELLRRDSNEMSIEASDGGISINYTRKQSETQNHKNHTNANSQSERVDIQIRTNSDTVGSPNPPLLTPSQPAKTTESDSKPSEGYLKPEDSSMEQ